MTEFQNVSCQSLTIITQFNLLILICRITVKQAGAEFGQAQPKQKSNIM